MTATPAEDPTAATTTLAVPRRRGFSLGNRPPLTGIRALAVAIILIYHSNFHTLPGAWIGPQVFFVLSGFLITAMLSAEGKRNDRISLRNFYERRAARLLPPMLLVIALLAIYASFVNITNAAQRVWGDSAATLFYYADYRQAFGHAPFFGFFAQSWSLSVEEQFYIVWSLLMVIAIAAHRPKLAYVFAIGGLLLSTGERTVLALLAHPFTNGTFLRTYYAFDPRADALFAGCLLGLLAADGWLTGWGARGRLVLTLLAAAATAFLIWALLDTALFQEDVVLWWLPITTLATVIILTYFVVCPTSLGTRLVGLGILVFIGNLSYTIYLVHFPVYLALQPNHTGWGFWPTELVRLAIIFGVAIASWYLMEKPLMRWRAKNAAKVGAGSAPTSGATVPA